MQHDLFGKVHGVHIRAQQLSHDFTEHDAGHRIALHIRHTRRRLVNGRNPLFAFGGVAQTWKTFLTLVGGREQL